MFGLGYYIELKVRAPFLGHEITEPCPGTSYKGRGPENLSFIHVSPPRERHKMIGKFRFLLYIVPESGK